jgi:hypothetical protein
VKGFKPDEGDGAKSLKGLAKLIAVLVILAVAGFGDVMYIIEIQKVFAGQGILLVFCYVGGIVGFMSVCYLLLGKSAVFRPGGQMLASWLAFGMELIVIALNIMYVFAGDKTGPLAAWGFISPATPVIHMLAIAIVYYLDPELKVKHRKMELDAKIALAHHEQEYAIEMAKLKVIEKQLGHFVEGLSAASNSETTVTALQEYADKVNDQILTEMGGRRALPSGTDKPKDGPKNPNEGRYGNR